MSEALTAIDILERYQLQMDAEGINVGVSRQALDEVLIEYRQLTDENRELRDACKDLTLYGSAKDCPKCGVNQQAVFNIKKALDKQGG